MTINKLVFSVNKILNSFLTVTLAHLHVESIRSRIDTTICCVFLIYHKTISDRQ